MTSKTTFVYLSYKFYKKDPKDVDLKKKYATKYHLVLVLIKG